MKGRPLAALKESRKPFTSRDLRLASGLVLGLFLLVHFSNIALGLISTHAMEAADPWLMAPWRSVPGTALLGGALLVHFGLALRALYGRRTLRMSSREAAQLGLGLAIPFLLAAHVVVTRIEPSLTGKAVGFVDEVRSLWITHPGKGVQQVLLLLVAWSHVSLGLWFWLRTKSWFTDFAPRLFAASLLVPILALLGFAEAGKQVSALPVPYVPPAATGWFGPDELTLALYALFALAILAAFAARSLRAFALRHSRVRVTYPDGQVVTVLAGSSVLEASRMAQNPPCLDVRRAGPLLDLPR